jgi:hypothetical protein
LQRGLIVRDEAGVRKRILRTEGDNVFWEYLDANSGERHEEHSTAFSEFADTHFVVPQPRRSTTVVASQSQQEAGSEAADKIRKDAIYSDAQGRRVRVMDVDPKMVQWIEVDEESGGVTPVSEFLQTYHPEGKAA